MLRENRDVMDKLAAFLIEKETITGKEFMRIFREAKGLPEPIDEKVGDKDTTVPEQSINPSNANETSILGQKINSGASDSTTSPEQNSKSDNSDETPASEPNTNPNSLGDIDSSRGLFSNGKID